MLDSPSTAEIPCLLKEIEKYCLMLFCILLFLMAKEILFSNRENAYFIPGCQAPFFLFYFFEFLLFILIYSFNNYLGFPVQSGQHNTQIHFLWIFQEFIVRVGAISFVYLCLTKLLSWVRLFISFSQTFMTIFKIQGGILWNVNEKVDTRPLFNFFSYCFYISG